MFIIDDLLFWLPLRGIVAIAKEIETLAKKELSSEERALREKLLREEMNYELGKISQKELEKRSDVLLKKLDQLINQKKSNNSHEENQSKKHT